MNDQDWASSENYADIKAGDTVKLDFTRSVLLELRAEEDLSAAQNSTVVVVTPSPNT